MKILHDELLSLLDGYAAPWMLNKQGIKKCEDDRDADDNDGGCGLALTDVNRANVKC